MKVWIDLANSPHPLLFAPLIERFRAGGADVVVTARDNAQTIELARRHVGGFTAIGGPSPTSRPAKARAIAARTVALRRWARGQRPDVALSHNSYAQIVAARALRVPVVTAMDYEHQPANHLAFRLADRVLLPAALPQSAVAGQGATPRKSVSYPGLKEELYAASFQPDASVLDDLGIERGDERLLVVARTANPGASYHRFENPLFEEALRVLSRRGDATCVVVPRSREQAAAIESMALERVVVARRPLDSRSLVVCADAFVGAGGTMTREAAVLGVPTFSLFAGRRPQVDAWLERHGSLRTIDSTGQLAELGAMPRRDEPGVNLDALRDRAKAIEDVFVSTTLNAATGVGS